MNYAAEEHELAIAVQEKEVTARSFGPGKADIQRP
jgi:hypothetical protein